MTDKRDCGGTWCNQYACYCDRPSKRSNPDMTTKKMTDPKTGTTVEVNNIPYGVYREERTEQEREDWFWKDVFVEAIDREGEVIDIDALDVASALAIVELAMTGILGKKVSSRRG